SPFVSAICENGTWPPVTPALGLSGIVIAGTPLMYSQVRMWPRSKQRRSCLSYASAYLKLDVPSAAATGAPVTAADAGSTLVHTLSSWPMHRAPAPVGRETRLPVRPDTLRVGSAPCVGRPTEEPPSGGSWWPPAGQLPRTAEAVPHEAEAHRI